MHKDVLILVIVLLSCTTASATDVLIFTEPPDAPYTELGPIEQIGTIGMVDEIMAVGMAGDKLKGKARDLGGNAYIVKSYTRIPWVIEKHQNNNGPRQHLLTFKLKIEAVAIRLEK